MEGGLSGCIPPLPSFLTWEFHNGHTDKNWVHPEIKHLLNNHPRLAVPHLKAPVSLQTACSGTPA